MVELPVGDATDLDVEASEPSMRVFELVVGVAALCVAILLGIARGG